jgi:hypothetical protein
LEENIKEYKAVRKTDCGQLSKKKNASMSVLEKLVEKKEIHASEALRAQIKLT